MPQAIAPHLPALTENPGVSVDPEPPSRSIGRQQPSSTPGSQFLPDQLSQLRELIAETVGSQGSGPGEAPGLLADVPLLSPASPLNVAAITATEQNLNSVNLPNVIQDGGLSLRQFVPSPPQASQGPSQQIVPNEHDLNLPPLPEKLCSKISKHVPVPYSRTSSRFETNSSPSVGHNPLAARLTFLQSQAIADSTRRSYQAGIRRYSNFCASRGWPSFSSHRDYITVLCSLPC